MSFAGGGAEGMESTAAAAAAAAGRIVNKKRKSTVTEEEHKQAKRRHAEQVEGEEGEDHLDDDVDVDTGDLVDTDREDRVGLAPIVPRLIPSHDPTRVAPAGILLRLTLRNFMNFHRFEMRFNPNVNFIHGMNGAGKIVFGAKAADTNRGKSIDKLVSHGKHMAEICVWIKNHKGPSAYKHELYGDEIQLTRRITVTQTAAGKSTATSAYTMSGVMENGKPYSTRSSHDVNEMCEAFNIQVSNPCVLMTQEVSKKFLQSKRPEDKYEFFLKATQLESYREKMSDAMFKITDMQRTVQVQADKLPDLEKRIEKLKKLELIAQEAEAMERDIQKLANQIVWRKVKDQEILYDEMEAKHNGLLNDKQSVESRLAKLKESHQSESEFAADVARHKERLAACGASQDQLTDQIAKSHQEKLKIKTDQRLELSRVDMAKQKVKELTKQVAQREKNIADIAEQNKRDTSGVEDALQQQRLALEQEKAALESEKDANTDAIKVEEAKVEPLREELTRLREDTHHAEQRLNRARSELASLDSAGGAVASQYNHVFGHYTQQIWSEIKRAQWHHEPIGPLGEYVQVTPRDEPWLTAIAECLTGKHMATYVVDNHDDQHTLSRIIAKVDRGMFRPNIMILKKRDRYPVQRPNVPFPLVIDCLSIESDWAFNAIVFLAKIERYGLHRDGDEAVAAIRPFRALHAADSNDYVTGSFLADGTKIRITGNSAQGSIISQTANEKPMFKVNREDEIRILKQRCEELQKTFNDLKQLNRNKADAIKEQQHKSTPFVHRNRDIKAHILKLDEQMYDIDERAERARRDLEKKDDTHEVIARDRLINELHEARDELREAEESRSAEHTKRLDEIDREVAELKARIKEGEAAIEAEESHIRELGLRWAKQESSTKKYIERLRLLDLALSDCEAKFAGVSSLLNDLTIQASNQCERDESDVSAERLIAQHSAKAQTLKEKRQRQPIDIDTVRLDLKTTQVEKATTEQAMTSVQNDLRRLQAMGEDRTRKMRNCRKTMANSANYAFNALLQPQGAQGQLLFNHTDQTLQMVVNPNTRDTERQDAASTVVLSGGERSVTTIAFVMAVGEQVECPFRAIDEFDVFQDDVNRRTSMDLLLRICNARKDRQFFFLTPLDITHLKPSPYHDIHKLRAPERNQTELNFRQEGEQE